MKRELSLATLEHLDYGKLATAFQQHLRRAVADCLDRPGDDSARKVTITFEIKPASDQTGDCERCKVDAQVLSKVPAHRTRVLDMAPRKGGHLLFDDDSPDDVNQVTLGDPQKGD